LRPCHATLRPLSRVAARRCTAATCGPAAVGPVLAVTHEAAPGRHAMALPLDRWPASVAGMCGSATSGRIARRLGRADRVILCREASVSGTISLRGQCAHLIQRWPGSGEFPDSGRSVALLRHALLPPMPGSCHGMPADVLHR
jgi:hypothetical protein